MGELHLVKRALLGGLRRRKPNIGDICPADGPSTSCGPGVYTLYRVRRAATVRGLPLAPLPCPQGGRGRRHEASAEPLGHPWRLKNFPPHVVEKPVAGKEKTKKASDFDVSRRDLFGHVLKIFWGVAAAYMPIF